MSTTDSATPVLQNLDRFFIGGEWVQPSSTDRLHVIDSDTEAVFFSVAEARAADMARAVAAARQAFDDGPWPRLSHADRAGYLRALATGLQARSEDIGNIWPRESGVVHKVAKHASLGAAVTFNFYAHAAGQPGQVTGTKLYPQMQRSADRYLPPVWEARDFFEVLLPGSPAGPPAGAA